MTWHYGLNKIHFIFHEMHKNLFLLPFYTVSLKYGLSVRAHTFKTEINLNLLEKSNP